MKKRGRQTVELAFDSYTAGLLGHRSIPLGKYILPHGHPEVVLSAI